MNEKERNYKLSVIWKSLNPSEKFVFLDGSQQYFLPRLKLERISHDQYELLKTNTDVYRPVDDFMVDFAYDRSLEELSRALVYTSCVDRLDAIENEGKEISDKALAQLKEKLAILETKSKLHLNQIKENYGNKQRSTKQTI